VSTALPKHLPRTLALFAALPLLSYGCAGMIADVKWGRPSSTAAIGIVTLPIAATVVGIAAFLVGLLASWLWRASSARAFDSPRVERVLLAALLLTCAGAAAAAVTSVTLHEAEVKPRVLRDSGVVQRQAWIADGWERSPAVTVASGFRPSGRADFSAGVVTVGGERVAFEPAGGQAHVALDLDALDSLRSVCGVLLPGPTPAEDLLVVLADGRATGNRALLAVFDRDGALAYEELLETTWGPYESGLAVLSDPSGGAADAVAVGPATVLVRVPLAVSAPTGPSAEPPSPAAAPRR
jgi:hypothetical protein